MVSTLPRLAAVLVYFVRSPTDSFPPNNTKTTQLSADRWTYSSSPSDRPPYFMFAFSSAASVVSQLLRPVSLVYISTASPLQERSAGIQVSRKALDRGTGRLVQPQYWYSTACCSLSPESFVRNNSKMKCLVQRQDITITIYRNIL